MKKVILYVRVSTDEQARLGYSLGHQEIALSEMTDLEVMAIFRETIQLKTLNDLSIKNYSNFVKPTKRKLIMC